MKGKLMLNYHCVILSCVIALSFGPAAALAVRPASGNGQAIKDAVTGILDKTDTLTTTLDNLCDLNCQSTDAGKMYHGKVVRMQQAQGRAKNANGRTTAADYEKVNRKNSKKKSVDGCDPDVQICVAGQSGQVTASSSNNEPEIDEETGKDTIANLNVVGPDVDQLNLILSGNAPPPGPTVYKTLSNAEYFFPESMWPSPSLVLAAFIADQVADKASAIATHFCDETVVALGEGGNGSAACAVTETIHEVLKTTYETMEFIVRERANAEVTGAYERIGDVYDQLLGTGGDINEVKQVVDAMGKELLILQKNQEYIMMLLTLPQGKRPGFPTGDGSGGAATVTPKGNAVVNPRPLRH